MEFTCQSISIFDRLSLADVWNISFLCWLKTQSSNSSNIFTFVHLHTNIRYTYYIYISILIPQWAGYIIQDRSVAALVHVAHQERFLNTLRPANLQETFSNVFYWHLLSIWLELVPISPDDIRSLWLGYVLALKLPQGFILLTWINLNPSMGKCLHAL